MNMGFGVIGGSGGGVQQDTTEEDNNALPEGGALFVRGKATLTDIIFEDNTAPFKAPSGENSNTAATAGVPITASRAHKDAAHESGDM